MSIYHGIDLVAFLNGELPGKSPRLLLSLLERLPEGAELPAEAGHGRKWRDWTLSDELRASTIDAINTLILVSGRWKKGKQPTIPHVPRPGDKDRPKKGNRSARLKPIAGDGPRRSLAELHAAFAGKSE